MLKKKSNADHSLKQTVTHRSWNLTSKRCLNQLCNSEILPECNAREALGSKVAQRESSTHKMCVSVIHCVYKHSTNRVICHVQAIIWFLKYHVNKNIGFHNRGKRVRGEEKSDKSKQDFCWWNPIIDPWVPLVWFLNCFSLVCMCRIRQHGCWIIHNKIMSALPLMKI